MIPSFPVDCDIPCMSQGEGVERVCDLWGYMRFIVQSSRDSNNDMNMVRMSFLAHICSMPESPPRKGGRSAGQLRERAALARAEGDGRGGVADLNRLTFGLLDDCGGNMRWRSDVSSFATLECVWGREEWGWRESNTRFKDDKTRVKTCIENQHVFIPFVFDTFGFLAPEVVELLSRVQRFMHNNVMTSRITNVVFKCIGFAIQKGLAAQLVARLPSTTM
ncbi:hypothetical protein Tco_0547982 [Tanacetum coccineum]